MSIGGGYQRGNNVYIYIYIYMVLTLNAVVLSAVKFIRTSLFVFDGLFYINIPCLSHNGMENTRTTIKY